MSMYTEVEDMQAAAPLWRTIVGWICLTLGLTGLLLPLLPGVPLLFAGLFLLSGKYRWARQSLTWLKALLRKITHRKRTLPNTSSYPK